MRMILSVSFAIIGISVLALGAVTGGPIQQSSASARDQYQNQAWVQDDCAHDRQGQALNCR